MIDQTRERLQNFIGRDEKPGWWYLVGVGFAILLAIFCWMQTGLFVQFYASRFDGDIMSYPNLRNRMDKDRAFQASLRPTPDMKESHERIQYPEFTESERVRVKRAVDFVLGDDELDRKLKDRFGTSLRDVEVVVAPIWTANDPDYLQKNGITLAGEPDLDQSSKSCDIGATTIRDKLGAQQKTVDGRPRIVFNPNALAYDTWTRRVVFHEMMHAMNLPGYQAPFAWAQTDLTYLPEYCWFVGKENLGSSSETVCRFFIGFFVFFCFVRLLSFVRHYRGEAGFLLSIRS